MEMAEITAAEVKAPLPPIDYLEKPRKDTSDLLGFPEDAGDEETILVARQNSSAREAREAECPVEKKECVEDSSVSQSYPNKSLLAKHARKFAEAVGALRTDEQDELYSVLKSVTHRPSELDQSLDLWVQDSHEDALHASKDPCSGVLALFRGRDIESFVTACLSGLVTGLLAIGFNCVKATLIFGASSATTEWIPIGVCLYNFCTIISMPSCLMFSDCKIAMGGPNIKHPLLFGPTISAAIVVSITGMTETGGHRRAEASSSSDHDYEIDYDKDELLSSILFAFAFSTFLIALCWGLMGQFRLTRVVQYLPEFVVSGFIAAVGYLIMLKALFIATGEHISFEVGDHFNVDGFGKGKFYYQLVPGAVIGLLMFFFKEYHIGKPVFVLPFFIFVPLVSFYLILFGAGYSIDDARDNGWFLEEFDPTDFYAPWAEFTVSKINFGAVFDQMSNIIVLMVVLTIDALLKLVAIRQELDIELDYDKEMRLNGIYNLINTAGLSAPGYILLKFTSVNYGIIHNVTDRLPGIICALIVQIVYFSGYPVINFLPRFFLAALVIFSGFSFIWNHMFNTFGRMPWLEYGTIYIIVLITALSQLVYAVLVGIIIAALIFVWKYARRGAVRATMYGHQHQSRVVRSYRDQQHLTHLGQLFVIVELYRYLFFGSVIGVQELVASILEKRALKPIWQQERHVLIDFAAVEGIDNTGTLVFMQIAKSCRAAGLHLLISGLSKKDERKFELRRGWSTLVRSFPDLDIGTEWVENQLLSYASNIRQRWLAVEPLRKLHAQSVLKAKHEAYEELLGGHIGEALWQYISEEQVGKGQRLCEAGEKNDRLYLLQSGRLTCYGKRADGSRMRIMTWRRGAYVNEDSLFLNMPVSHTIVAEEPSRVIVLTRQKWLMLEADDPIVAMQIQRTVMLYTANIRNTLERTLSVLNQFEEREPIEKESSTRTMTFHAKFSSSVRLAVQSSLKGQGLTTVYHGIERTTSLLRESSHDFHHLPRPAPMTPKRRASSKCAEQEEEPPVVVSIHMSRRMRQLSKKCFAKHVKGPVRNAGDDDDLQEVTIGWNAPRSPKISARSSRNSNLKLNFEQAHDALMDLGKFPTLREFRGILKQFADREDMTWADYKADTLAGGVSESLFLQIVKTLDLAEIANMDLVNYRRVFEKYTKDAGSGLYLTAETLGLLMEEMHHPENPLELQKLVTEWSSDVKGHIDFGNFVSIIAHFLKNEELDEQVEEVFKSLCRHRWADSSGFDAEDLRAVMGSQYGVALSAQEASEMIWEAAFETDKTMHYGEFIDCITMVSDADLHSGLMTSRTDSAGWEMQWTKNDEETAADVLAGLESVESPESDALPPLSIIAPVPV